MGDENDEIYQLAQRLTCGDKTPEELADEIEQYLMAAAAEWQRTQETAQTVPDADGDARFPGGCLTPYGQVIQAIEHTADEIRAERSRPAQAAMAAGRGWFGTLSFAGHAGVELIDPLPQHHVAAREALRLAGEETPDPATVDHLARAMLAELPTMMRASGFCDGIPWMQPEPYAPDHELDGMLRWDALFVQYLRTLGDEAGRIADSVENDPALGARRRFSDYQHRKQHPGKPEDLRADLLWGFWRHPTGEILTQAARSYGEWLVGPFGPHYPHPPRFLVPLALALWVERVKPETDLAQQPRFRILGVGGSDGDDYVRLPKPISAASWAIGGEGVELDGDRYAAEPKVLVQRVPRAWAILPREALTRPHQLSLPLADGTQVPLVVALTEPGGAVIPAVAGKLLLVMFAGVRPGGLVTGTLGDLARQVYPDAQRIQPRELVRVAHGLKVLENLRLVLPDDTEMPLFSVQAPIDPAHPRPDQCVGWELTRLFAHQVQAHGPKLRGWFLLNLTGAMRLDSKRPQLLRQYVRACALWNDAHAPGGGEFDPDRVEPYTAEEWARLNNTLSRRAVDYLASERKAQNKRDALAADLKTTRATLDELAGVGLIELSKRGRNQLLILPPDTYLEAHRKARRGAGVSKTKTPTNPGGRDCGNQETR
jgi:hypothetical protein